MQVEVDLSVGQKLQTLTSPECSFVDDDYVYMQSPYKNKKLGKKNKKNMKLDSIMKTQIGEKEYIPSDQIINEYFVDDDLPQDVLMESLLVSQIQQQPQSTATNDTNNTDNTNNNNNDTTNSKPSEEISSEKNNNNTENVIDVINACTNVTNNTSNVNNDQYLADLLLAMDLQQAEENSFKQRRAHDEIYNGKYTKVRETAPKVTTNDVTFYYDVDEFGYNNSTTNLTTLSNNNDNNDNNNNNNGDLKSKRKRRRKNKKMENNENNESQNVQEENNNNNNNNKTSPEKKPIVTKHDPIVWNQKHCQRLKAYEAMGDVNANDMHISNKAFNAIRYRLERKGYTKDPPQMNM